MSEIKTTEIRIRCISKRAAEQLESIAKYHGVTMSDFMKHQLISLLSSTPEHIKNFKKTEDDN